MPTTAMNIAAFQMLQAKNVYSVFVQTIGRYDVFGSPGAVMEMLAWEGREELLVLIRD